MTDFADKQILINDIWARWREADYTWKGLAKRDEWGDPIHEWYNWVIVSEGGANYAIEEKTGRRFGETSTAEGPIQSVRGRKATLQDYWRADVATGRLRSDDELVACGALVRAPGQPDYHAAHLPLEYADGAQTLKGLHATDNPELLDALVDSRRAVTDTRAMFDGGVWLKGLSYLKDTPEHNLSYEDAIFVDNTDFRFSTFSWGIFRSASFLGDTNFDGQFKRKAWFKNAIFVGKADFLGMTFGDAIFDDATFGGSAVFGGEFQEASFTDAKFHCDTYFRAVEFARAANFRGVTFTGDATFASAKFQAAAEFSPVKFKAAADFTDATFSGDANFADVIIWQQANFTGAHFLGRGTFSNAKFYRNVLFGGAKFLQRAIFTGAKFSYAFSFRAASFAGITYFNHLAQFPQKCWHWQAAFSKSTFETTIDFSGNKLGHFAAFDGAIIKGNIELENGDEKLTSKTFIAERMQAIEGPTTTMKEANAELIKSDDEPYTELGWKRKLLADRLDRLTSLERGCRVLKNEMVKQSDKQREQMFYKFELLARRAQHGLRPGEREFSLLYDGISDYGASITRPLAFLVALFFLLAAFLGGWAYAIGLIGYAHHQTTPQQALWEVLEFCWTNTLKPLSVLTIDATSGTNVVSSLLLQKDGTGFWVRVVATIQSFLVVVLAFLFGLAVRRRFQMN